MLKTPKTPANGFSSASILTSSHKDNSFDAVVPTPPHSEIKWPSNSDVIDQKSATDILAPSILETPSKTKNPPATSRKRSNNIVFVQTPSSVSSGSLSASSSASTAYTGTYKFEMVTPVRKPNGSGFAFISHSPTTFPLLQPEIDDLQLARRKRRRTSPTELQILEDAFNHCMKPSRANRENIARRVGMNEKAVQIWFQNRRQAFRKQEIINGISPSALAPQKKSNASSKNLEYDMQNLSPAVELIMRKHIAIAPKKKMQSTSFSDSSKDEVTEEDVAEGVTVSDGATPTTEITTDQESKFANASNQSSPAPVESERALSASAADLPKQFSFDTATLKQQTPSASMELQYTASTATTPSEHSKLTSTGVHKVSISANELDSTHNIFPTPQLAVQSHTAGKNIGSITNTDNANNTRSQKFLTEGVDRYRTFGHKFGVAKTFSDLAKHEQYKSESLLSSSSDDGSSSDSSRNTQLPISSELSNRDSSSHRAFKLPSIDIAFKAKSSGFTIYSDNTDDTDGEEASPALNSAKKLDGNKRQIVGLTEKKRLLVSGSVQQPSLARLSMLSNGQARIVFEENTMINSTSNCNDDRAKFVATLSTTSTLCSLTDDDTNFKAPAKSRDPDAANASPPTSAGVKTPVAATKAAAKSAASLLRSRLSKSISKAQQFLASAENTSGIASHSKTRVGKPTSSTPPGSPSKRKRLLAAAAKRSPLSPRKLGQLPQPSVASNYGVIPKFDAGSPMKGKSSSSWGHHAWRKGLGKSAGNHGVSAAKPVHRVTKDISHHNSIRVASFSALPKSQSFTSALLMRHQAPSLLGLAPATATCKSLAAAKRHHSVAPGSNVHRVSEYPRYIERLHSDAGVAYDMLSSSSSSDSSPPPKKLIKNQHFQLALAEKKKAAMYMSSSSSSSGGGGNSSSSDEDDKELWEFKKKKLQRQHHKHHHQQQQQQPQVDNTREAECINNLLSLRSGDWA